MANVKVNISVADDDADRFGDVPERKLDQLHAWRRP
jgi:hypothetical protein